MADMKVFVTSAKNGGKEQIPIGEPLTVMIDDREVTFLPPTTAQFVLMLAGVESAATEQDHAAGAINFIFGLVEDEDKRYLFSRLRDRQDDFDLDDLMELIEYITEEWSARPTDSPSESSGRRQPSGRNSTARRHRGASTRGTSA